ncbi:SMT3 [Candida oxycetoniae]|uniref:SMT3 n=1 Tax=Candida oxycetoniae TaxID=497107 RepID=A0AAI9WYH9_9ASCO|nr:SMT3 [Candida oxycetoniae]KAI3404850.2 SMT3 [Candida oxycetoniae]
MSEPNGETVEVETPEENGKISIRLEVDSHVNATFTISRDTKLRKLIRKFCDNYQQDMQVVRFYYEDVRIKATDTPNSLQMQDGDTIMVKNYLYGA